jgi:serine/arginine repetitive matrix protein 1
MRKVNLMVIRPWIAKKVVELFGFEDEVVVEYAMGFLGERVCVYLPQHFNLN